ncbi:hypothetical protein H9P43_005826 [Blastocladiella emersonii ATCC 22665]|nr:hypothetical protein H9P43_005826 [Blastocladiella emersonii ATCC 22665]
MNPKTVLFALLAVAASTTSALPGGAPACAINEAKITSGMGAPQGDRQFKLSASTTEYEPGKPITMKVVSDNAATKTYKGLLIYVEPAGDAKKRVGSFKIPEGFKSNVDKCGALQVTSDTDAVVTHSSPADKPLGAELVWTAPANAMGELTVRAVVAGAGPKNWQIVQTVTLKPKMGGGAGAAPAPPAMGGGGYGSPAPPAHGGGYGTPAPPAAGGNGNGGYTPPMAGKRKVCKKWRKKTGGGNVAPTQPAGEGGYGSGGAVPTAAPAPAPAPTQPAGEGGYGAGAPPAATAPAADAPAATQPAADGAAAPGSPGYDNKDKPADGAAAAPAPPAEGAAADPAPPAEGAQGAASADGGDVAQASSASGIKSSVVTVGAALAAAAVMLM